MKIGIHSIMANSNNWTDGESAARRRILVHLAQTSQSFEEFSNFVSDMQQLMPVPGDLLVEVASGFNHLKEHIFSQQQAAEDYNSATSSSTAEQDDNPSSKKKLRIQGNGGLKLLENDTLNLRDLYSGDLGELMISYTSVSDLCKLDLLNKQFQRLTANRWDTLAYERFGMTNGKDSWRAGTSLLRKPVFIHIHGGMRYAGEPSVSSNNSLIAIRNDEHHYDSDCAPVGVNLYDATNLTYLQTSEEGGVKTLIAGPKGNELFVSFDVHSIYLSRRNVHRKLRFSDNILCDCMKVIASDTHVIAINGCSVILYRIVSNNDLVNLCGFMLFNRKRQNQEYYETSISWGVDESEFIVYSSIRSGFNFNHHTSKIIIFGLDAMTDTISPTQTFSVNEIILQQITLGKDFIAGSCRYKKIYVWDRHTQQKMHNFLRDTEEIDDYNPEECFNILPISCQGHILISASHRGVAICIWDMKTGKLLKRHNDAEEAGVVTMVTEPFEGDDAYSMAYVKPLNCFICMSRYMNVWSFPTNQQQMDNAVMIREREEDEREEEY